MQVVAAAVGQAADRVLAVQVAQAAAALEIKAGLHLEH
jgi:hypothetical protein